MSNEQISGSDMSLSASSTSSKTSVIDTVTGHTHKFVIVKTKETPSTTLTETLPSSVNTQQISSSNSNPTKDNSSFALEASKKRHMAEVAKIFATRKNYKQNNTVGAVPSQTQRLAAYSIFSGKSPLASPHYDAKFFDSSLIELRSQNSSTSTVDYADGTEDIWVKRPVPEKTKVSYFS